jgi:hypothetical protein
VGSLFTFLFCWKLLRHMEWGGGLSEGVSTGPLEPSESERVTDSLREANTHALCADGIVVLAQITGSNPRRAPEAQA